MTNTKQVAFAKKAAKMKAAKAAKAKPFYADGVLPVPTSASVPRAHDHTHEQMPRGPPRLIDKAELLHRVPISYPTIWLLMREGKFPRSRQVGDRALWVESEINAFIAGLPVKKLKGDATEAA